MITREAREAMNELDELAEEELDDKRTYTPRRDYYETALDEVSTHGTHEDLEQLKDMIGRTIEGNNPLGKVRTFRSARRILTNSGNPAPEQSPLHRAGRTP